MSHDEKLAGAAIWARGYLDGYIESARRDGLRETGPQFAERMLREWKADHPIMTAWRYEDLEQEAAREKEEAEKYEAACAEDAQEATAMAEIGRSGQNAGPWATKWNGEVTDKLLRIMEKRAIERQKR